MGRLGRGEHRAPRPVEPVPTAFGAHGEPRLAVHRRAADDTLGVLGRVRIGVGTDMVIHHHGDCAPDTHRRPATAPRARGQRPATSSTERHAGPRVCGRRDQPRRPKVATARGRTTRAPAARAQGFASAPRKRGDSICERAQWKVRKSGMFSRRSRWDSVGFASQTCKPEFIFEQSGPQAQKPEMNCEQGRREADPFSCMARKHISSGPETRNDL